MRWPLILRLLKLGSRRQEEAAAVPQVDQEPHLRTNSYSRLADIQENGELVSRPSTMVKPIQAGDAAAVGQRLTAKEKWVRVDATGKAELVQVDKQELVTRLWIPFRDLRQLDPMVPIAYPSSIFIRERALVVNVESVRMIIAKDQVYITSIPVPGSADMWAHPSPDDHFVQEMCYRLAPKPPTGQSISSTGVVEHIKVDRDMPFELRALEAALAAGIRVLELAAGNLERAAFPALEALLHNVSRVELDKVRAAKSVTTHLLSRVGRLQKELEEILDDDQDMADMYLGRREELEVAEPKQGASPKDERGSSPTLGTTAEIHPTARPAPGRSDGTVLAEFSGREKLGVLDLGQVRLVTGNPEDEVLLQELHSHKGPRELRTAHPHDIEDCENLLENYFMQVEFLNSRLTQLKERTDDTEDLINIELDHRRNELVSLDLILTALASAFGFVACVAGIFGMNLAPLPIDSTQVGFYTATFSSVFLGLCLLIGFIGYAYWKKILLIPSM